MMPERLLRVVYQDPRGREWGCSVRRASGVHDDSAGVVISLPECDNIEYGPLSRLGQMTCRAAETVLRCGGPPLLAAALVMVGHCWRNEKEEDYVN